MARVARLLVLGLPALLAVSATRPTAAQELALAERGPRFLVASAKAGGPPVEIEAATNMLLRQEVSLTLDHPTVGRLLKEISRQTGLEFFYGEDVVPPDRPVALSADRITVATALVGILMDAGVDVLLSRGNHVALVRKRSAVTVDTGAVVGRVTEKRTGAALAGATVVVEGSRQSVTTGQDGRYRIAGLAAGTYTLRARYIGYAPAAAPVTVSAGQEATADFTLEKSVQRLDEVVTTGTLIPTEVKALPTPITVISSEELERKDMHDVSELFRGDVPGTVGWQVGSSFNTVIAVRGASSLTGPYDGIKTYVDGVELSSSFFSNMIDPAQIDHVEIIRGPEASTLYGSEALTGVMQIFTKRGQAGQRPRVEAKVEGGVLQTQWNPEHDVVGQHEEGLTVSGGGPDFSYNFGGSYRYVGPSVPQYFLHNKSGFGGLRGTQGPLTVDFTGRYSRFDEGESDVGAVLGFAPIANPNTTDRSESQQLSLKLTYLPFRWWQTTLTLGYEHYGQTFIQNGPKFPGDTALNRYESSTAKPQVTFVTSADRQLASGLTGSLSIGSNYVTTPNSYQAFTGPTNTGALSGFLYGGAVNPHTFGHFAQAQVGIHDAIFLTAGLRAETSPTFGTDYGYSVSPRFGIAAVHNVGGATLKARAAYGRAIRAPYPGERDAYVSPTTAQAANPVLAPEAQQGFDGGLELYVGGLGSIGATYYHQTATNLIDYVLIDPGNASNVPVYQYQNVGKVRNTGLELEAHLTPLGPVSLSATYSLTNAKALELGNQYTGDVRVGEQLLGHPRHTAGATATYAYRSGSASLALTYIGPYKQTDVIALFGYYFNAEPYRGSGRDYWADFPSITKLQLSFQQQIAAHTTAFLQMRNLTNSYTTELYNNFLPQGRATTVGLRFHL